MCRLNNWYFLNFILVMGFTVDNGFIDACSDVHIMV